MTRVGLAYAHPYIYQLIMRLLHRGEFDDRYTAVTHHVPAGSSVLDLCCGDGLLASYLPTSCTYTGLDINARFVEHGKKTGRDIRLWDGASQAIPEADVVCMQGSLFHFYPQEDAMLRRMLAAAKKRVIIAEPVENWTSDGMSWQRALALRLTSIGGQRFTHRNTEASLRALVAALPSSRVETQRVGRELIVVIDK